MQTGWKESSDLEQREETGRYFKRHECYVNDVFPCHLNECKKKQAFFQSGNAGRVICGLMPGQIQYIL